MIKNETLLRLKDKVEEWFYSKNTIDKLLKDKLPDFVIIEEHPTSVIVGGLTIYVGVLTWQNYRRFLDNFAKIMGAFGAQVINMEMLGEGIDLYDALMNNKKLDKELMKLVNETVLNQQDYYIRQLVGSETKVKLPKCSFGYFKRNISIQGLIQILFLIYLYNFDAEKKNFKIIAGKMSLRKQTEIYMYSWLASLGGLTVKFGAADGEKPEWWDEELEKKIIDQANKEKELQERRAKEEKEIAG